MSGDNSKDGKAAAPQVQSKPWEPGGLTFAGLVIGLVSLLLFLMNAGGMFGSNAKPPERDFAKETAELVAKAKANRFEELHAIIRKEPFYNVADAVKAMGQPEFCKPRDNDPNAGLCTWMFSESGSEKIMVHSVSTTDGVAYNGSEALVREIFFVRNFQSEERVEGEFLAGLNRLRGQPSGK